MIMHDGSKVKISQKGVGRGGQHYIHRPGAKDEEVSCSQKGETRTMKKNDIEHVERNWFTQP